LLSPAGSNGVETTVHVLAGGFPLAVEGAASNKGPAAMSAISGTARAIVLIQRDDPFSASFIEFGSSRSSFAEA
jgi:hypothetical protein